MKKKSSKNTTNCLWHYCILFSTVNGAPNNTVQNIGAVLIFIKTKFSFVLCFKKKSARSSNLPNSHFFRTHSSWSKDLKHFKKKQLVRISVQWNVNKTRKHKKDRTGQAQAIFLPARHGPCPGNWERHQCVPPRECNYQVSAAPCTYESEVQRFEKTLSSCLVWQESGTKYVFFSCFIEWVTQKGIVVEGGRMGGGMTRVGKTDERETAKRPHTG